MFFSKSNFSYKLAILIYAFYFSFQTKKNMWDHIFFSKNQLAILDTLKLLIMFYSNAFRLVTYVCALIKFFQLAFLAVKFQFWYHLLDIPICRLKWTTWAADWTFVHLWSTFTTIQFIAFVAFFGRT